MSRTSTDTLPRPDASDPALRYPVKWYRSSYYNAVILGLCNFFAPGLWGAMNSLGAGGAQSPYLVNTANALIFSLMVVTALLSSVLIKAVGARTTLIIGTLGYAPYAAGLYTNNRFGTEWSVLFGAAMCGLAAGTFWMVEAAIALCYPEADRQGKCLGLWLTFKIAGQIVGGAINLGVNADKGDAGSVSHTIYLIFIALQCLAPVCGLFLTPPSKVQRTDGKKVDLTPHHGYLKELHLVGVLFMKPKFLLLVPLIASYVYTESVMFTYSALWNSVRARALGSFLSGVAAAIAGNLFGRILDNERWHLKRRAQLAFAITISCQGAFLAWNLANSHKFTRMVPRPNFDWDSPGFGNAFAVFIMQVANFQICYMALFWFCGEIAETREEVVRIAGLLRAVESASQAVSYGLSSIESFADTWGAVVNLGMWGAGIIPAWFTIKNIGVKYGKSIREAKEVESEKQRLSQPASKAEAGTA